MFHGSAFGGWVSQLQQVGFSPDGKYFAFKVSRDNGMSSVECVTTTYVDVLSNKLVGQPHNGCTDAEELLHYQEELVRKHNAGESKLVAKIKHELKIDFSDQGITALKRKPFRYWFSKDSGKSEFSKMDDSAILQFKDLSNSYKIKLMKKPVKSKNCRNLWGGFPFATMKISLTNLAQNSEHPIPVDTKLPKSRDCPFHYRIQEVYAHDTDGGKIFVALIQYFTPSIEGPDELYLVVTGRLE